MDGMPYERGNKYLALSVNEFVSTVYLGILIS